MPKRKRKVPEIDPARNVLEVISSLLDQVRNSDRKVAQLVLANPAFVLNATWRRQHAGRGSVNRPLFDSVRRLDRKGSWARRQLDKKALIKAVEILEQAKRIEFFGFGASGIIALDAQQKFPLFGVPCLAHPDSHQQFIAAAMLQAGDVAVAISNTGQTIGIIEVARVARHNGAAVIGISGSDSPLLRHCEVGIMVETLENTDMYTPTISRIAGLVIIDILATAVALRRDAAHDARLSRMKQQLAAMRTGHLSSFLEQG
jgi:DNA-binding MurR/RpiR family transcriptional regulator